MSNYIKDFCQVDNRKRYGYSIAFLLRTNFTLTFCWYISMFSFSKRLSQQFSNFDRLSSFISSDRLKRPIIPRAHREAICSFIKATSGITTKQIDTTSCLSPCCKKSKTKGATSKVKLFHDTVGAGRKTSLPPQ